MRDTHAHHTRLYMGTLRRHAETATGMNSGIEPVVDARLNELEFFTMSAALEAEHGIPAPKDPSGFAKHFPRVLQAWKDDQLKGAPEPFTAFEDRVGGVLHDIGQGEGSALVVTSGGFIAMAMRLHLKLDIPIMANVGLAIMNSSMHRFYPVGGVWSPVMLSLIHISEPTRPY